MSLKINFINDNPAEIAHVVRSIRRERIEDACRDKDLPFPSNSNNFLIWVRRGKICLAYKYTDSGNPTEIIDLLPIELPKSGWKMHLTNK